MRYLAIFDLDGTLNRTDLFAVPAHMEAMEHYGSPKELINADFIISTFGMRRQEYMRLLLPNGSDEDRWNYLNMVRDKENEYMKTKGRAYDSVHKTLDALRKAGCQTAVCSNASLRYITAALEAIGLIEKIDHIQHLASDMTKADTLKLLLDRLKPDRAVMIGDRIFDIEAARINNIPSIGCLYGFCPQEAKEADASVDSADKIAEEVFRLFNI